MKKILFIFIGALILGQGLFGFVQKTEASYLGGPSNTPQVEPGETPGDVVRTEGGSLMPIYNQKTGDVVGIYYFDDKTGLFTDVSEGKDYINSKSTAAEKQKALAAYAASGKFNAGKTSQDVYNKNKDGQGYTPKVPPQPCVVGVLDGGINLLGCAQVGANILLTVSSYVLWLAGVVFNFTLGMSLNLASLISSMAIVNIGWTIFRDISNICFIFILLAIAIATILQIESYNVKKLLRNVILVALLLNFSLFFTKVVIDASNILALQFYAKITADAKAPVKGDGSVEDIKNIIANADGGLSSAMIRGLGLTSIYSSGQSAKISDTAKSTTDLTNVPGEVTFGNLLIIGVGGSILILITAFVFLAGTILFLIRTVVLVFVMVLSPVAFLSLALPATSKYFADWRKALLNQSFFAPLYLIMIWIVFAAINGNYKDPAGNDMNFGALLSGSKDSIGTIYTFAVLIGFMIASLVVAKKIGANGADFAGKTAGSAMFGAGAWAGRQSIGRAAKFAQDSRAVKFLASNKYTGFAGRRLESGLKRTTEASFDARNIKSLGDVAGKAGGKGGYAKSFDNKVKDLKDQQKRVGELSQGEQSRKDQISRIFDVDKARFNEADIELKAAQKAIEDNGGAPATKEHTERLEKAQKEFEIAKAKSATTEARIKKIDNNAKTRKENYLNQPDLIHGATQFVAKKTGLNIVPGITTAQIAMVRSVRKEENESEEKKALKVLKKAWEKENKEKADAEPKEEPKEEKKK